MPQALSRLDALPAELKLIIYSNLRPTDLWPMSLVSAFWRMLVLTDKRWNVWLSMLVDTNSGEGLTDTLRSLQVDVSPHILVSKCFDINCASCGKNTDQLFVPLLKRVCKDCLDEDAYAVAALSSALTAYDVRPKEAKDAGLVVLDASNRVLTTSATKLVCVANVKKIALAKHSNEVALVTHLNNRKARALAAYKTRFTEYQAALNAVDVSATSNSTTKAKIPKTCPQKPAVLRDLYTPRTYTESCTLSTNYLNFDPTSACVAAKEFKACRICRIIHCLRSGYGLGLLVLNDLHGMEVMTPEALSAHRYTVHYARRWAACQRPGPDEETCKPCLNRYAVGLEDQLLQEEEDERLLAALTSSSGSS